MGKILQLPHAEEVPIYYSCLLIELCKCHPTVYPLIVSYYNTGLYSPLLVQYNLQLSQATKMLFEKLDGMNSVSVNKLVPFMREDTMCITPLLQICLMVLLSSQ